MCIDNIINPRYIMYDDFADNTWYYYHIDILWITANIGILANNDGMIAHQLQC